MFCCVLNATYVFGSIWGIHPALKLHGSWFLSRISETQASVSLTFEKIPENACLVHWFQYLSSYLFCFTRSFAWLKPYSLERIRFDSGMPSFQKAPFVGSLLFLLPESQNLHRALSLQSHFAQSHWLCFLSVQGAYPLETKPC